jgi:hypothetical protein
VVKVMTRLEASDFTLPSANPVSPQILIIEDENALAKALAAVCQRLGAASTLCASGKRGLKELKAGRWSSAIRRREHAFGTS